MNKRHLIGYPVAVILALTIGAAGVGGSTPVAATPAPAVTVTKTVAQAPAECGTVLDLLSEFAGDVAAEHGAMSDAAGQAGQDGDLATMTRGVIAAVATLNDQMATITPRASAAAQVCRAAIK